MEAVDSLDGLEIFVLGASQVVGDVNPFHYQDLSFQLDLPDRCRGEVSVACVDATRLQRASEGSSQSASGCRHQVVDSGGIGRVGIHVCLVMLGDPRMDTERDVVRAPGKPRLAYGAPDSFDLHFGSVHDF